MHILPVSQVEATPRKKSLADMNLLLLFVLLIATASAQGNVINLIGYWVMAFVCWIPAKCWIFLCGPFYKKVPSTSIVNSS